VLYGQQTKKIIDPIAPRYTAISKDNIVIFELLDGPKEPFIKTSLRHKKNESLGHKVVHYSNSIFIEQADAVELEKDEEITLMDWGNVIVKNIEKRDQVVTKVQAVLHLDGDFKKTKKKLTWLANVPDLLTTDIMLVDFGHLLTKKKLEEGDDITKFVNPQSKMEYAVYGDPNLRLLKKGEIIQLERRGYYICDQPLIKPKTLQLFFIPDGKRLTSKD